MIEHIVRIIDNWALQEKITMQQDPTELIEGENSEGQSDVSSEGGDTSGSGTVDSSPTDATADPNIGTSVSE